MSEAQSAGNVPIMENLEANKNYAWCACGKSENGIWCNGSHKGSSITPKVFKVESEKKQQYVCAKRPVTHLIVTAHIQNNYLVLGILPNYNLA